MIVRIENFLKKRGVSHLQSPDYLSTNFCSSQWKALANFNYFQLPNDGLIIAVFDKRTERARFCARGYKIQRGPIFKANK